MVIEETLLSCTAQPNLGPSNITVTVGGVDSLPSRVNFIHYDDAGNFSFELEEFFVSELEYFGNISVIRHDYISNVPKPSQCFYNGL